MPVGGTMDVRLSWLDRIHALFESWLGSAIFRRRAAAFAPTRPIARRRARALFDLCAGFVYTQILLACVRLRVFEILAEGPQTAASLALRFELSPDATARLLDAAVALKLVRRSGGDRYGLGALGASLVGNDAVLAMIEHHALLYTDLRDPVQLLRDGPQASELARYWPYSRGDDPSQLQTAQVARYGALMTASQPLIADEVLQAYSFKPHRCLLDVGGGEGAFLAAVAQRAPHLRLMLFDLPAVAERAGARLRPLGARFSAHGGSFLSDELPRGADVISLVRVLHDHDDAAVARILGAVRRALPADGVVLIAEPMSGTRGAEPVGDAYFGFYLLAMGRGRPRTPQRLEVLLREAGFAPGPLLPTHLPIQTRLMLARPA